VVSYVESSSGVEAGGRTGLTAITVGVLMLLSLFLAPLFLAIPAAATAPILILVGVFMLQSVAEIDFGDLHVAIPAALVIIGIPLTFSIAEGIGFGLITAALLALLAGKPRGLSVLGYVIAAVFFLSFFKLPPFHVAH
jgi:AGZA family xanthine/uracil permease-like MFS transporter